MISCRARLEELFAEVSSKFGDDLEYQDGLHIVREVYLGSSLSETTHAGVV